jgi:CheY-like chemotaxis protein
MRILVVEDSAINQKLALGTLAKMGYQADVAANGWEALEALRLKRYDLVFMDLQMPEMDGLEATRQIHARWKPEERPVIAAMTANAMRGDREQCFAAGMDDYLSKPVLPVEMQAVIERWGGRVHRAAVPASAPEPAQDQTSCLDAYTIEQLRLLDEPGKPSLMENLLKDYLDQTPAAISQVRAHARSHDWDALKQRVHKLAGTSVSLGARSVGETCHRLEEAARAHEKRGLDGLVQELEQAYDQAKVELKQLLGTLA